ncbi:MAG: ImmA/IrrE family metallo-endopeptidase, partial [Candidatus Dormibacteria bacterium]
MFPAGGSAPINVEYIAQRLNATVRYAKLGADLSGMLIRDGDRTIISVARSHAKVRQRFTIAHELGHLLLHP